MNNIYKKPELLKRNVDAGFTLLELLVAMSLFVVLITIASTVFINTRRLVNADSGAVSSTQNVRSAVDIMAADIRQAGENLSTLNVKVTGMDFNQSNKTITVRRAIPDFKSTDLPADYPANAARSIQALPICYLSGDRKEIRVASTTTVDCTYNAVNALIGNSDDQNIAAWRRYFVLQSGRPQAAIIYTPGSSTSPTVSQRIQVNSVGNVEFTVPLAGVFNRQVSLRLNTPAPSSVTASNGSLIILVDERNYVLDSTSKRLMFTQGADASYAQPLAFGITNMSIQAKLNPVAGDGATETLTSQSVTSDQDGAKWARVKEISLSLTGTGQSGQPQGERKFTTNIFPRNVETLRGSGN